MKNASDLEFSKEDIEKALSACGFPMGIRGEALTLQDFADLTNQLLTT